MGDRTRWVGAETYDHARKPMKGSRCNDKGRNGHGGAFPYRINRNFRRVNNCDEGEFGLVVGWGFQWGLRKMLIIKGDRPLRHVNYMVSSSPSIEIEFGDFEK